jgi:hypothetical protein
MSGRFYGMREILHGACPETLRKVYPEPAEILRVAQDDRCEGLRVTVEGFRMTTSFNLFGVNSPQLAA